MAQPLVMGDRIQGQCAIHRVPNPASGTPQPSPAPMAFSAAPRSGFEAMVTAGGRALATSVSRVSMCAQAPGQPVATVGDVTVA